MFGQEPKEEIPSLPNCIAYLAIVILVTVFLFFISEYFWLRVYTTEGAAGLLNLFGVETTVYFNQGSDIVQICAGGDCFYVIKICSGIEAIALVSGLIIATPTSWRRKVVGTLFISFGIFGANILRILTTILLARQGFNEFIYHQVVSAIFTIIFIIVFVLMIQAWIVPNFIDHMINVMIGIVRVFHKS
jgi:exosortase/archaeosortase family protein